MPHPPHTTTWLTIGIGPHNTELRNGRDTVEILALGSERTSAGCFQHDMPTALELETAIAAVEDELMRVQGHHPAHAAPLATSDRAVAALADAAGVAPADERVLWLDAVEALFQRLASATLGHPGALRGMPRGREASAVLLVLLEFMHHRGFAAITVVEDVAPR